MRNQNDDAVVISVRSEETGKCANVMGQTSKTHVIKDSQQMPPHNHESVIT